jgi:hypothetical protein
MVSSSLKPWRVSKLNIRTRFTGNLQLFSAAPIILMRSGELGTAESDGHRDGIELIISE